MTHPVPLSFSSMRWGVVALGAIIPVSTALDNLILFSVLIVVLLNHAREAVRLSIHHPVARASILLFTAMLIGTTYGDTPMKESWDTLLKYDDLAFVPLIMLAASPEKFRRYAMTGFLAIMAVTALLSWLVALHFLAPQKWMWAYWIANPLMSPAIFRSQITQNVLMAYAVFLLALLASASPSAKIKWRLAGLAVFLGSSILFLVGGKTGYFVLLALLAYFTWIIMARRLRHRGQTIGWHEGAGLCLLGLLLALGAYQTSPRLHTRLSEMAAEFKAWQPDTRNETSTGIRLDFYYNTLALIKQHPLAGVGTGGFHDAYAEQVRNKNLELANNPHNEFLFVTSQIGFAGLALLLYLFHTQWKFATKLPSLFEQDAARGLVMMIAITSLFNSPLHDHTEGIFFAYASALLFANLDTLHPAGARSGC